MEKILAEYIERFKCKKLFLLWCLLHSDPDPDPDPGPDPDPDLDNDPDPDPDPDPDVYIVINNLKAGSLKLRSGVMLRVTCDLSNVTSANIHRKYPCYLTQYTQLDEAAYLCLDS